MGSTSQSAGEGRMEEIDEIKFEELDELLDEIEDLEEIKDVKDCSFNRFYAPIRSLFSSDSQLLDKFSLCKDLNERLRFLVEMEVVKNSLADIQAEQRVATTDNLPDPSPTEPLQWKSVPKLSYGPNKKYPHLSKAVEVKCCPKEGRYMVAKQKILPGDVLMVDTAYATSLFEDYYKSHCNMCFIRITGEPVPCPTCNTVKYCSSGCMLKNYQEVHRWECSVLEYMDNPDIGRMATLAYRVVAQTGYNYLSTHGDQLESMEPTYKENDYISVFKQEDNRDVRPIGDHLKRCVTGLILTRCLQISGWFPEDLRNNLGAEKVIAIASILVRHIQSGSCNAYEINEFIRKGSSMVECESVELGGAVYPTISLSNHACSACKDEWPTYRDLAREQPEYYCWSCKHYLGNNLDKVKKCPRCKKDLKGIGRIEKHIQAMHRDFRQVMDDIQESTAEANIKKYSVLLTEIEKVCKMPCKEVITCQQILLQCFAVLGNNSRVELDPETAQVALYTGAGSDYGDSDEDDDEDMPGLI